MNVLKSLILVVLVAGGLGVGSAKAESVSLNVNQGTGWILLNLDDLNQPLQEAGYPALPEGVQLYGGNAFFSQQETPWRWGISGLYLSSQAGEIVALDAVFLGGALDWIVRHSHAVRLSMGTMLGVDVAELTLRKGRVFDFEDVLNPHNGQRSNLIRWGAWTAPYLKYELSLPNSPFSVKAWGGYLWTPWLSDWSQSGVLFDPTSFPGPPNTLSGPYVMLEWSLRM